MNFTFARILAAIPLAVAVVAKSMQLVRPNQLPFANWWFVFAAVEAELLVLTILILPLRPTRQRLVAVAAYSVFILVSLYKFAAGHDECGCFGHLPVHPGIMCLVDAAMLIFLISASCGVTVRRLHLTLHSALAGWAILAASTAAAIGLATPKYVDDPLLISKHEAAIVDGHRLLGTQIAQTGLFSAQSHYFMEGTWLVVMVTSDCQSCELFFKKCLDHVKFTGNQMSLAVIIFNDIEGTSFVSEIAALVIRNDAYEVYFAEPCAFVVSEGVVVDYLVKNSFPW